jgi:hypothetical protein
MLENISNSENFEWIYDVIRTTEAHAAQINNEIEFDARVMRGE